MGIQNKAPSRGRGNAMKKSERTTAEEALRQLLDDHKKTLGEMIQIKIDNRTYIEVPASMSEEDRKKRVKNYLQNTSYKPSV